ncbi:glyoxalase [Nakamurella flavida]|uniref:Glyoxalase n=1 Tax=Nakamurella flavida TaxID=363630 RepID=A0A939C4U0_9ACTN|nr:glyoxalase [Nakamurella flavida]MBM9475562.1 glyoxalase [Nakamurella flavida]MDP9778163.1 putative glyoxalase superfamily protein PhnB [Nakamurella flavida]
MVMGRTVPLEMIRDRTTFGCVSRAASLTTSTTQLILTWASPTAVDPRVCDVDISVEVDDVERAHAEAVERGLDVVYPLADEAWGIRRFFVRDGTGRIVNVASHRSAGR